LCTKSNWVPNIWSKRSIFLKSDQNLGKICYCIWRVPLQNQYYAFDPFDFWQNATILKHHMVDLKFTIYCILLQQQLHWRRGRNTLQSSKSRVYMYMVPICNYICIAMNKPPHLSTTRIWVCHWKLFLSLTPLHAINFFWIQYAQHPSSFETRNIF
jgi:hypothetical protein